MKYEGCAPKNKHHEKREEMQDLKAAMLCAVQAGLKQRNHHRDTGGDVDIRELIREEKYEDWQDIKK